MGEREQKSTREYRVIAESLEKKIDRSLESFGKKLNSGGIGFDLTLHIPRPVVERMEENERTDSDDSFMKRSAILSQTPDLRVRSDEHGRKSIEVKVDLYRLGLGESARIFILVFQEGKPARYYEVHQEADQPQIVIGKKATEGQLRDFNKLLGFIGV